MLQRIQLFFNKDQDKKKDEANSEDLDEHVHGDELEVQNDDKINSLEVMSKKSRI